jgi:hypothetical protein
MPITNAIPVEFYPAIDGSTSNNDGQIFYLRAERVDGSPVMLGFLRMYAVTGAWQEPDKFYCENCLEAHTGENPQML